MLQGSMDQWICRIEGQSANLISLIDDARPARPRALRQRSEATATLRLVCASTGPPGPAAGHHRQQQQQ